MGFNYWYLAFLSLTTWSILLTYDIRQDEVPAGDEGPKLAHCHVAVQIRRARPGYTRSKLSVTQSGHHWG